MHLIPVGQTNQTHFGTAVGPVQGINAQLILRLYFRRKLRQVLVFQSLHSQFAVEEIWNIYWAAGQLLPLPFPGPGFQASGGIGLGPFGARQPFNEGPGFFRVLGVSRDGIVAAAGPRAFYAHRVGTAFLLASIQAALGVLAMEIMVHFPRCAWLDSVEPAMLLRQLPLLLIGAAVYIFGNTAAYRIAAKRFEKVDL